MITTKLTLPGAPRSILAHGEGLEHGRRGLSLAAEAETLQSEGSISVHPGNVGSMAIVIRTNGRQWPAKRLSRVRTKLWARRRENSIRQVEVHRQDTIYTFLCESLRDYGRCAGLFLKEPGTCEWIERTVKPGDIFYDIGANIGVYSILAGQRVGPQGRVIAFEPHAGNFAALSRNIEANGFAGRIVPCGFALHRSSGFFDFNYSSLAVGSSRSQLDGNAAPGFDPFEPVVRELKYAAAVDDLVLSGRLPRPTHVKIDVDGNEEIGRASCRERV